MFSMSFGFDASKESFTPLLYSPIDYPLFHLFLHRTNAVA